MYAIIETGGKQYRVELGTELEVERLPSEAGSEIVLDRVLLVADGDVTAIGRPLVSGAEVRASVVRQDRGDKIVVFKYKAKTRHRSKRGHRQELTILRIADIVHEGRSAAKAAEAEARTVEAEREEAAREAAEQAKRDAALAEELAAKTTAAKAETEAEAKAAAKGRKPSTKADAAAGRKADDERGAKTAAKGRKPSTKTGPKAESATKSGAAAPTAKRDAADETTSMDREADTRPKVDNTKAPRRRNRKDT